MYYCIPISSCFLSEWTRTFTACSFSLVDRYPASSYNLRTSTAAINVRVPGFLQTGLLWGTKHGENRPHWLFLFETMTTVFTEWQKKITLDNRENELMVTWNGNPWLSSVLSDCAVNDTGIRTCVGLYIVTPRRVMSVSNFLAWKRVTGPRKAIYPPSSAKVTENLPPRGRTWRRWDHSLSFTIQRS